MSNVPRLARPLTVAFVVFGWLTVAAVAARAEDTAAAREHYQKATAFFDLGKYQEAIKEFEAAYEAKNDPAFLYNLAQAHRLAGNPEQALRFYRTYLRRNPNPPNRADIDDRIKQLEKLVEQKAASQNSPPKETIQPSLPAPPAAAGAASPTWPPATSPPAPDAVALPPAAPAPVAVQAAPSSAPSPLAPVAPGDKKGSRGLRIAGWVLAGVGVTAIIVGAAYGQAAQDAAKQIKTAADNNGMFTAELQAVDTRGRHDQTLEFTYLGIGAASIVGGIVCYYFGWSSESSSPKVALVPSVSPTAGAALVRVAF